MLNKENFKDLLIALQFEKIGNIYQKHFSQEDFYLKVDFDKKVLIYPEQLKIGGEFTTNFSSDENFVVFECVNRLLSKGYKPQHIELEPKWKVGHGASGGRADIFVRDQQNEPLLIIECKTAGKEFQKEWKEMQIDGGQLFSYIEQEKAVKFVCLYASNFEEKTNEITLEQRIISHKDNEQILKDDTTLKSFKDAQNVKERYKVWLNTYQLEFTLSGIFEENIQAYQIGKDKYTLDIDTKAIDSTDKKGKYHQFRTILRKYNVSRRENAFEVLVNLFLCKIVDETENPNDLKFYWKGIAYDSYYDLVDRLQELYKIGMQRFLHQDIVYISNAEIDGAFWAVKGEKGNVTKQRIKDLFKELKFYKGLDFEFIKVFNKQYFEKNAKILLEIIQMWQGLRLKTKEQNQFLGDMFEFFLDNGIKQSEGQFFTPVPICKFIVASLPLENNIQAKKEPLRAIDYACGSGHFLTEYALQIKPFIKKHKQVAPSEYYKNIFGIEKEDRLAKVAKVSAFMYGQEEINIIDADALAPHEDIKTESFDVLVANPPFAVEDFLMTLDEKDREDYELLKTVSDLGNKNIQCFFLERSKQLLAPNGVTGIIIPSSILSNGDTMHIKTREILLQYFDFVSITELGSGTFGKTGTNTVVLFLRRKAQRPEPAALYWERIIHFFDNWEVELETDGNEYKDLGIIRNYCQHINVLLEDYQQLFLKSTEGLTALLKYDMFKDYKDDFDSQSDIKKLLENKNFKAKTAVEKEIELNNRFFAYLHDIEKQKLYYFMLAHHNPTKVLIVKSPNDNKEQKQFLGYEWSGAKGAEGIKYNGGDTVYDIVTPLFDPKNTDNKDKINFLIQQNFINGEAINDNNAGRVLNPASVSVPENLQSYVSYSNLVDLLDFSRTEFNKTVSLNVKKRNVIESKWDLVKLENLMQITRGASPRPIDRYITDDKDAVNWIKIGDVAEGAKYVTKTAEKITKEGAELSRKVEIGDFILSNSMSFGRPYIMKIDGCVHDGWLLLSKFVDKLNKDYLYEILSYSDTQQQFSDSAAGGVVQNLNTERVKSTKIPLPPLSIQQQIVSECEAIDKVVEKAKVEIEQIKTTKEQMISSLFGKYEKRKISEIAIINPSKTEIKNVDENTIISFVEMASVSEQGFIATKIDKPLKDLRKGSYTYFAENDIIIAKITPCMENGKCAIAKGLTNNLAMGSSEFHVIRAKETVLNKYLFALVNREIVRKEAEQNFTGSSGHRRVPASFYESFSIPVPTIEIQQKLVAEIEKIELQITENQLIVGNSANEKQAIMKKYLND